MKSDLLANVSHELRTPLTAIKGYTDYILERKLGTITRQAGEGPAWWCSATWSGCPRSINALLDFSRMDVGRITLNIQPFQPGPAGGADPAPPCAPSWRRSGCSFAAAVDADLPPRHRRPREALRRCSRTWSSTRSSSRPRAGRITVSAARGAAGAARPTAEIRVARHRHRHPAPTRSARSSTASTRWTAPPRAASAASASAWPSSRASWTRTAPPSTVESEEGKGTVFRFRCPLLEQARGPRCARPRRDRRTSGWCWWWTTTRSSCARVRAATWRRKGCAVLTAATRRGGRRAGRRRATRT